MPSTPPPASPASEAPKPKKKICCACPDTKRPRDEVRACARVRAARARAACSTQARAHESLAFNAVRNLPHAPRARAASAHGMRCWCGVGSAWRGLLPQRPRSAEARQSPAVRLCPCPCPCAASDGRTCRLPPTHPPTHPRRSASRSRARRRARTSSRRTRSACAQRASTYVQARTGASDAWALARLRGSTPDARCGFSALLAQV